MIMSMEIFSFIDLQEPNELEKAFKLLDLIPKRGPFAFDAFYETVLQEGLYEAADVLRPDKAPHTASPGGGMGSEFITESSDEEEPPSGKLALKS